MVFYCYMNISLITTKVSSISFKAQTSNVPAPRDASDVDNKDAIPAGPDFNPVLASKITRRDDFSKTKKEIQSVLDKCIYGKSHMLDNIDDLSIVKRDDKFYLNGFYNNYDKDDELTGNCEELAYKAGKALQEKFKDKYNVVVLSTSGTKYGFAGHSCLAMIKKNKENDRIVNLREKIADIQRQTSDFDIKKNISNEEYKKLKDLEAKAVTNSTQAFDKSAFLEDAIFIDPSFDFTCRMEDLPNDYDLLGFNCSVNEASIRDFELRYEAITPLGMTSSIFPEIEEMFPDTVVSFSLQKFEPFAVFINGDNCQGLPLSLLKQYFPNNKVVRFLDKLNNEINRAKDK